MAQIEKQKLSMATPAAPVAGVQMPARGFTAWADNDNGASDISDERVLKAARLLVARHSPQAPIELSAFDTPHNALAEISAKLEKLGVSHAVSEPLIDSLKAYVLENGGSFARAANAKPIHINMAVRDSLPPRRFESGVTEVAYIGQKMARVEGASSINVRLTATGTAMTSNAADVDAMFANVKEKGLWLRYEAPTKQDLDGLMSAMEGSLATAVQAVGGAMDADDLKKLLATLEENGVLIPQVEELISGLITLQEALAANVGGSLDGDIKTILAQISETLSNPEYVDFIPPSLAKAALDSLQSMSSHPEMPAAVMEENGFGYLVEAEQERLQSVTIEAALETFKDILSADNLDPEMAQSINDMIESVSKALDSADANHADILGMMREGLESLSGVEAMPAEAKAAIDSTMSDIKAVLPESAEIKGFESDPAVQAAQLMDLIADIAQKIESGELSKADIPNDLADILDKITEIKAMEQEEGREAVIAEIVQALEGKADPDFSAKVESIVLAFAKPELQVALPAELSKGVETFIRENPSVVEAVATNVVVRDLVSQVQSLPANSPEAEKINELLKTIKAEGLSAAVLSPDAQAALPPSAQNFLKQNPSVIEAVAVQAVVRDLVSQAQTLPPNSPEAQQIKEILQTIKAEGLSAAVLSPDGQAALPPSVQVLLKENPSIIEAVATQAVVRDLAAQVQSLPPNSPEAQQIKEILHMIKADGLAAAVLSPDGQAALPPSVQVLLKENPSIIEAVATQAMVRDLTSQVQSLPANSTEARQINEMIQIMKTEGLSAALLSKDGIAALSPTMQVFVKHNPWIVEIVARQSALRNVVSPSGSASVAGGAESQKSDSSKHIGKKYDQLDNGPAASDKKAPAQNVYQVLADLKAMGALATVVSPVTQPVNAKGANETARDQKSPQQAEKKNDASGNTTTATTSSSQSGGAGGPSAAVSVGGSVSASAVATSGTAPAPANVNTAPTGPATSAAPTTPMGGGASDVPKNKAGTEAEKPATKDQKGPCAHDCRCGDKFKVAANSGNDNSSPNSVPEKESPYKREGSEIVYKNPDGSLERLTQDQAINLITADLKDKFGIPEKQVEKIMEQHNGDPLKAREYVVEHLRDYEETRVEAADFASRTTSKSDLLTLLGSPVEKSKEGLTTCFTGCACPKHGTPNNPKVENETSTPTSFDSIGDLKEVLGVDNPPVSGGLSVLNVDISAAQNDETTQKMNDSFGFADFKM